MKKFLLVCMLLTANSAMALASINNVIGKKAMVLKDIIVLSQQNGVFFQDGRNTSFEGDINYDTGGGICFLRIANGMDWQNKTTATVIKSGTVLAFDSGFVLRGTTTIQNVSEEGIIGFLLSTDNTQLKTIEFYPIANNWIEIPEIKKNPSLLNEEGLKKCLGEYIAIAK